VVINRLHLLPRRRALLASDPAAVDLMAARPFPTADLTRSGLRDGVLYDAAKSPRPVELMRPMSP
jgi:hypothetical protein